MDPFSDELKIAKITPIYKSVTKTDLSNYRPVSVLPIISKIFERVMHERLNTDFIQNRIRYLLQLILFSN